jgi:hypothetical protein
VCLYVDQQGHGSSAVNDLLSRSLSPWEKGISDYFQLMASCGSRSVADEYVFSLSSSMAYFFGAEVPSLWLWRPFQATYVTYDPTVAEVIGYLCSAFGFFNERPGAPLATESADTDIVSGMLRLGTGESILVEEVISNFVQQSPLGGFVSVKVSIGENSGL